MDELIRKLEVATEGSRELDDAIWHYLLDNWPEGQLAPQNFSSLKRYTTSIDAALSLVPEGWSLCINTFPVALRPSQVWTTRVTLNANDKSGSITTGHASTPALALCIAALKARKEG